MGKPIIRIGRIAGQYAKPRSNPFEVVNGTVLPSYRGDMINSPEKNILARTPNPELLLKAYSCSAMTLNFIRALSDGGFADIHHPQRWDLDFVKHSKQADEYHALVHSIADSLDIADSIQNNQLNNIDFFTSHEALHLHYEQALTRKINNQWYLLSTHLPWIGVRTAYLDSAHVEFMRGICNSIGIKIGPNTKPTFLIELIKRLNPDAEEGRLLLISRMGAMRIEQTLPALIKAVQACNIPVTWSCDPMHGNTETTKEGIKTRHFDNILLELKLALKIHQELGSHLGGVHFELTGDNVTECIGGARGLAETDLKHAYQSLVDPRLNYEQSLEMAIQLSRQFDSTRFKSR